MGTKWFGVAVAVAFFALIHVSFSVPFIMIHGISAECSDKTNSNFPRLLTNLSGSHGFCLEIGNGKSDSWLMPLTKQAKILCDKVKQIEELRQGYNIVARSQGNLIARGLIEFCDDGPKVYNYISLAGPHAGISSVPWCGNGIWCVEADKLIEKDIYTEYVQDHLAPSGYIKIPTAITKYLQSSKYLPKLNNEIPKQRNATYKERFTSLQNLVLVKVLGRSLYIPRPGTTSCYIGSNFQNDTVIVPRDSSWFGFYPDGANQPLLSAQQTKLYTEDWIGLKTLDDAGKVKFVSVPGGHLQMATSDIVKFVVPYLQNQPSSVQRLNREKKKLRH